MPAQRIGRVAGPVLLVPVLDEQHIGDHIGSGSLFRQDGVVGMPDSRDGVERRRPLGHQLGRAAQVHDGRQADVPDQPGDVGR